MAMQLRLVGTLLAVLWLGTLAAVSADPTPPPLIPGVPSSILNNPVIQSIMNAAGSLLQTTNGPTAHGKVTYFNRFDLQLQTAPGVYRDVHLHQGTIINPRGATIRPGMLVDVSGTPQSDGSLNANSINAEI